MSAPHYNILVEPCIPVVGKGRVSLLDVFKDGTLTALSGTPLQKIALMKFLLAIAQAAATPADEDEWLELGPEGMAERCVEYLKTHADCFWLYGSRPFLQMPACEKADVKAFGAVMPEVAFGNTTLLTHIQLEPELDDAGKFLLLLVQMSLCFGGKKPYNKLVLTPGYEKKASAKPGPGICHMGLLHTFFQGRNLWETLWFNILTREDVVRQKQWTAGLGIPPWERMPEGEACPVAEELKSSLMGRLIPMARFCLLTDKGLKFTEGIVHPDYSAGMVDPSAAMDASGSKPKMLWTDPEKRPWRQLPALLSFLDAGEERGFFCLGLQKSVEKLREREDLDDDAQFGIWSGGIRVSSNAGEQYLTGRDDVVDSETLIKASWLGSNWFRAFSAAMGRLEDLASLLYVAVNGYHSAMKVQDRRIAAEASGLFWQMVEPSEHELMAACDRKSEGWTEDTLPALLRRYRAMVLSVYDEFCPHDTARQFEAWVLNRPFSGRKNG